MVELAGDGGDGGVDACVRAGSSVEGGTCLLPDVRFSDALVLVLVTVLVLLFLLRAGSPGLAMVVRGNPRGTTDCGRADVVRFGIEGGNPVLALAELSEPSNAANAPALASVFVRDLVDGLRPKSLDPETEVGLPNFDAGGSGLLFGSSMAFLGFASMFEALAALLFQPFSSPSSLICGTSSPDGFRLNVGRRLLRLECFSVSAR